MKLRECENFLVLGLFLGLIGLLSALVLSLVSALTAPAIEQAELNAKSKALEKLAFGPFDNKPTQEKCELDGVTFMAVRKSGKLVGIAAEAETSGYAGKIKELVGFKPDDKQDWTITVVLVTEEKETPGLGKEVCSRKFKKTIFNFWKPLPGGLPPNEILDQFSDRRAGGKDDWRVTKDGGDFKFRTGATVTSRAVTSVTGKAAKTFAKHRREILGQFKESAK